MFPTNFPWTLNNTGMHVLSFGSHFEVFSCFVLGKYSENHPQTGRMTEEDKWTEKSLWNGGVVSLRCYIIVLWNILWCWDCICFFRILFFGVILDIFVWFLCGKTFDIYRNDLIGCNGLNAFDGKLCLLWSVYHVQVKFCPCLDSGNA